MKLSNERIETHNAIIEKLLLTFPTSIFTNRDIEIAVDSYLEETESKDTSYALCKELGEYLQCNHTHSITYSFQSKTCPTASEVF